ncbi:DUF1771-domain-containing protein [Stereum hirsutum FP-91666 SS1]|uniref:DUF1771-domain-containing protein n=1 Tax=Stereum hirsutum (strain FP-91666) TaxID=721885 RepID=UPI000444A7D0|nr:DUF1771-domain-containing protein [Stereum hirsutum FP-91666 SS1]EIM82684.1 DUF1771-domain-containing protein [Stereum hirsutum FP-91666 SS1]
MLFPVAVFAGLAVLYYLTSPKDSGTPRERYEALRAEANQAGDAMARTFEESRLAFDKGEKKKAKELSNEGKLLREKMERLNVEASEMVFRENNMNRPSGEVDLHDLYVKEAIAFTDRSIRKARRRGDTKIKLIVGKGIHSTGAAKLKPAIEELMQKNRLVAALDEQNAGVLIVQLDGVTPYQGDGRLLDANDIASKLDKKDDGCHIM